MTSSAFDTHLVKEYTWICFAFEKEAWNMKSCQFPGILTLNLCILCCLKTKNS